MFNCEYLSQYKGQSFDQICFIIQPGQTATKPAVTYYGESGNTRDPKTYSKQTVNFNQAPSNMTDSPEQSKENERPFKGPITMPAGTYAIPWSMKLPRDWTPSAKIVGQNKKQSSELQQ